MKDDKMKRAIFIVGFNNWGKTRIINRLFNRQRYGRLPYAIQRINAQFIVENHSNDDYNENDYINAIQQRINNSTNKNTDLFCALCPTRDSDNYHNDSVRILQNEIFNSYDEIILFLIEYKWDNHAKLIIDNIQNYLSPINQIRFVVISTINTDDKINEIRRHLIQTYQ